MRSFLILFAAIAPPALLYSALSETDFAAIRELAPWALMLVAFWGMAVAVRARVRSQPPTPEVRAGRAATRWRAEGWRVELYTGRSDERT